MSSIISYKNETLVALSNGTKTLNTASKYMEDNIVVSNVIANDESIYQDADGYIVLASGQGSHVHTEVLVPEENGTYEAEIGTAYDVVNVDVDGFNDFIKSVIQRTVTSITPEDIQSTTSLRAHIFRACHYLESADISCVTTFLSNGYQLSGCSSLKWVKADLLNTLSGGYFFQNGTSLTDIYIPKASAGIYTLRGCTSLVRIFLPFLGSTKTVGDHAFNGCTSLSHVDLGACTSIAANAFYNCSTLNTLILRRTGAVTSLSNISAFTGTPFASGGTGGTIYVPSTLIDTYKAATNWTTVDGYGTITWEAIEGSIYENLYEIKRTLTNCSSSCMTFYAYDGESYITNIVADDGCSFSTIETIMDEEDISDTCYLNGTITINSITGNINITATAQASDNLINVSTLTLSGKTEVGGYVISSTYPFTDFMEITPSTTYYVNINRNLKDDTKEWNQVLFYYDSEKNYLSRTNLQDNYSYGIMTTRESPEGAYYARIRYHSSGNEHPYYGLSGELWK